jgi:Holliday junction resolvase RusA-like endonuclease
MVESSKRVAPWRDSVAAAAADEARRRGWTPLRAVDVTVTFMFRRPKSHYGSGRNASTLKPFAPRWHSTKPDLDKLLRSTFDALTTSGVITDDSRIVCVQAYKLYVEAGCPTGASITLTPVGEAV